MSDSSCGCDTDDWSLHANIVPNVTSLLLDLESHSSQIRTFGPLRATFFPNPYWFTIPFSASSSTPGTPFDGLVLVMMDNLLCNFYVSDLSSYNNFEPTSGACPTGNEKETEKTNIT